MPCTLHSLFTTFLLSTTYCHPLSDDLILDAPVSSNPSSTPRGADTPASSSPKIPSPKAVPGGSVLLSPEEGPTGSAAAGITAVSPVVTKDGSDFSTENLFEGALTEPKEGTSNILQSEAEIIEGFIKALGAREKDGGGESSSVEECRPGSVRDCLFIHSSGEPSSQEVPPIDASPKWDGTPTQPSVEVLVPPEPLATAEGTSLPLMTMRLEAGEIGEATVSL
ncbi:hypothetical protein HAX54_048265 [Datura stramonium]|uniref:Uncharacterized protein n=1 Tax=Datura stramonium TaxID=4076 RepID=A0ABS8WJ43_DATST|nr:hypothetical protein [Datura stramonium]